MKSDYSPGEILFEEDTQKPFIHDGWVTADGFGIAIGFAEHRRRVGRCRRLSVGECVLCRTSGKGNFNTSSKVRLATSEEREWLMNQIAIAKDIPFYSCI